MESNSMTPNAAGKGKVSTPASRPSSGNIKMSAGLKEKLRRLGRYHGDTPSPSVSTTPKTNLMTEVDTTPDARDRFLMTPVLNRTPSHVVTSEGESDGVKATQRRLNPASLQLKRKLVNDENDDHRKKWVAQAARPFVNSELKAIHEQIKEREEELRKLRLVKLYRTKNDLDALESLTERWRSACQKAVTELHEKTIAACGGALAESRPLKLAEFLGHLQISLDIVRYDADDEDFY